VLNYAERTLSNSQAVEQHRYDMTRYARAGPFRSTSVSSTRAGPAGERQMYVDYGGADVEQ